MTELTPAQRIVQRHTQSIEQVQDVLDLLYGCEQCTEMALLSATSGVTPILVCLHRPGLLSSQRTTRHIKMEWRLMKDRRDTLAPREVPYFEFTTVSMYGVVSGMHDDSLEHRAKVDYTDDGTACSIQCSCSPRAPWTLDDVTPHAIQRSFEQHLTKGG